MHSQNNLQALDRKNEFVSIRKARVGYGLGFSPPCWLRSQKSDQSRVELTTWGVANWSGLVKLATPQVMNLNL